MNYKAFRTQLFQMKPFKIITINDTLIEEKPSRFSFYLQADHPQHPW